MVKNNGSKPKNFVQSIERVSIILETLSHYPQGLSLGDLSRRIDLSKGTTHRLLSSLTYLGYTRQISETKNYSLGFKLVELGNRLLNQIDFRIEARPYLLDLAESTKETVHLVILDQQEALYIDKVEAGGQLSGLRMVSTLGSRIPAHCTAVGKVLLAALPEIKIAKLVNEKGLIKRTENTITDFGKLKTHLQRVRMDGYALDQEENEIGINCIGAPIRDSRGEVIAAISISGPVNRMEGRILKTELKNRVTEMALRISRKIGYQGFP